MASTYRKEEIKTSPLFRARFQLGDTGQLRDPKTNAVVWLLADEEIEGLIDLSGYAEGVAEAAEGLAVRFAQEPDEYTDEAGVKVKWSLKISTWMAVAKRLRAGIGAATPPVGSSVAFGITKGPSMEGFRA